MTMIRRLRSAALNPAWVCFLWTGMIVGVSMIATPVKFSAPLITRPIALDVGRVVFAAFNKTEIVALLLLLIVVRVAGLTAKWWAVCALLALIVLAQGAWLIPELTARAEMIISGGEPPASYAHGIYAALEMSKIALLLFLGFSSLMDQR